MFGLKIFRAYFLNIFLSTILRNIALIEVVVIEPTAFPVVLVESLDTYFKK